jgi:hypothetical protein
MVHPDRVSSLDPREGIVIAETATTGRFILSDLTWESVVGPNANTSVAYMSTGQLKIYESLGMSLYDYIRGAAYALGIGNHLDARYLLEIEILAEDYLSASNSSPFKYVWPIMITSSECSAAYSEKGTEYNLYFSHTSSLSQSNLVQPINETMTVSDVKTLEEYFNGLQKALETQEFNYAQARQKAGSEKSPGGQNPAASDPYHDEYHFILDPKIKKFTFTSKGPAGKNIRGTWFGLSDTRFNISLRPGSTIVNQITKILQSTNEIANLLPGRQQPAAKDATGSSERNKKQLKDQLGEIYKFFRIETATVYKNFDYIRSRYAVKHVFLIFLADQANMYQYPDEIDEYHKISNKARVQLKLKKYIQEGLLQKTYYHMYTGLSTDILKVDLNFNYFYALPSFPVIWTDRGTTGPGPMNIQNYNRRINPYNHRDDRGVRQALNSVQSQIQSVNRKIAILDQEKKKLGSLPEGAQTRYKELVDYLEDLKKQEATRRDELRAAGNQQQQNLNTINNRSDLLKSLIYAEDLVLSEISKDIESAEYPNLRPRMEPDSIQENGDSNNENQKLSEKLYNVLVSPKDLIELNLQIIGDPFWLGVPNILLQGSKDLDKIELAASNSAELKTEIQRRMNVIDRENWSSKRAVWGDYGTAQWYKGSPLFYFNTKMPDSEFDNNDLLKFYPNDQVVGIYLVKQVINEFKNGIWTQTLKSIRDTTIPAFALPKGVTDQDSFEKYREDVLSNPQNLTEEFIKLKQQEDLRRAKELEDLGLTPSPAETRNKILNRVSTDGVTLQRDYLTNDPPPVVNNPVDRAKQLVAQGKSKDEAYQTAKNEYVSQVQAYSEHMYQINVEAYKKAGITEYQPYSAKVMSELAITRSSNGGLEDWKNNIVNSRSPGANNNPAGIAYDSGTKSYTKFESIEKGLDAANEYFNYGAGVKSIGRQGQDRLLLPSEFTGDQANYIKEKLKGSG